MTLLRSLSILSLCTIVFVGIVGLSSAVHAAAPSGGYSPGATLDPDCAPGDTDCTVAVGPAGATSTLQYNDGGSFASASNIFYASSTQRIGIGTSTPASSLSILVTDNNDGIRISNNNAGQQTQLDIVNDLGVIGNMVVYGSNRATGLDLNNHTAINASKDIVLISDAEAVSGGTSDISFRTGGFATDNERLRITSSGNVGIGTSTPQGLLSIVGSSDVVQQTVFANSTQTSNLAEYKRSDGANVLTIDKDGNIRMPIDLEGRITGSAEDNYLDLSGSAGSSELASIGTFTVNINSDGFGGDEFRVSNNDNRYFTIDQDGLVGIGTSSPAFPLTMDSGAHVTAGGVWTDASSREFKENFQKLDRQEVLSNINSLTIDRWNYKEEADDVTHIGPVAEEFHQYFDVGGSTKTLASLDTAGVALIGVQALSDRIDSLEGSDRTYTSTARMTTDEPSIWETFTEHLAQAGVRLKNGIARIKNLVVNTLTIGSSSQPTQITVYDKNGDAGCLTVDDVDGGDVTVTRGVCGSDGEHQTDSTERVSRESADNEKDDDAQERGDSDEDEEVNGTTTEQISNDGADSADPDEKADEKKATTTPNDGTEQGRSEGEEKSEPEQSSEENDESSNATGGDAEDSETEESEDKPDSKTKKAVEEEGDDAEQGGSPSDESTDESNENEEGDVQ